jgi:hypothetical protein
MIFEVVLSILLSIFSTAVMSYVCMAMPIGPWVGPMLVLIVLPFFRILPSRSRDQSIALVSLSGSIGGILATGCAFSYPTLYFLDPVLFDSWMASPIYFAAVLSGLSLSAALFGFWIANVFEHRLIVEENLAFPIGQLMQKMIAAQHQIRKAYELVAGFVGTFLFCMLQSGTAMFRGFIPRTITLVPHRVIGVFEIPRIQFDLWPMLWAIGFITGHVIAVPLLVGALAKIVVVDPTNQLFFSHLSSVEFVLAFCSGMVLVGAVLSFAQLPSLLKKGVEQLMNGLKGSASSQKLFIAKEHLFELGVVSIVLITFLSYFNFSPLAQLYLVISTFIWGYQIAAVAGKIGMATLGRYATFAMIPAMFLFNLNFTQIVLISTFVEIAGGVAVDVLFGRKLARMTDIKESTTKLYQLLGIVVSSMSIGIVFWLLIKHFGLGSEHLSAYRAQSRRLLIDVKQFDYYVLLLGGLFGYALKYCKVNPALVLGGLLMPLNISIGLIVGGFSGSFVKDRGEWEPFWSGVFASNSIWMLLQALSR